MSYTWLRALHIVFVVTWFAGLFYIFRLFVYHVENWERDEITALLSTMERRLYYGICWPAMVATTLFGALLFAGSPSGYLGARWFQVKLVGLLALFGYHFYSGKTRRELAARRRTLTARQCRIINEAPTVLLFLIVIMAVVKPALP